ncbi:MAG: TIGR00296 family protein, partial [Thaumarchaeota archaeon]|nr:TIGR00296 family protein [Nitrososphaerota archaeon]
FTKKIGCFVTLKNNDYEKSLRGCIGFPEPVYPLLKALPEAAIGAATGDPRFPPVKKSEVSDLLLEISLLTEPVLIRASKQSDIPEEIMVGRDGLIMKWSFGSGLLLPQVATEYGWDAEDFLCNLSVKAGAPPDEWLVPGTFIYRFAAQVFQENSPLGSVTMIPG